MSLKDRAKSRKERKMRITNKEIQSTIEMIVNAIYDEGENSFWSKTATEEEWVSGVYDDLVSWKSNGNGICYRSNENRFDGKAQIVSRIVPLIKKRVAELRKEGYQIKAWKE